MAKLEKNKLCKCGATIWSVSPTCKKCWGLTQRGKVVSEFTREKLRAAAAKRWADPEEKSMQSKRRTGKRVGADHPNWKGGITPENVKLRNSNEYKDWRLAVFARDGYACVSCGDSRGGNLQADHIKPFAYFPALRFDINNGRTLCKDCHKLTPTFGGTGGRGEYV